MNVLVSSVNLMFFSSESPEEVTADKEKKDSLAKLEALDKSKTN